MLKCLAETASFQNTITWCTMRIICHCLAHCGICAAWDLRPSTDTSKMYMQHLNLSKRLRKLWLNATKWQLWELSSPNILVESPEAKNSEYFEYLDDNQNKYTLTKSTKDTDAEEYARLKESWKSSYWICSFRHKNYTCLCPAEHTWRWGWCWSWTYLSNWSLWDSTVFK